MHILPVLFISSVQPCYSHNTVLNRIIQVIRFAVNCIFCVLSLYQDILILLPFEA